MRSPPPPIRFLLGVVCGWTGLRIALLAPPWGAPAVSEAPVARADNAAAVDTPARAAAIMVTPSRSFRAKPKSAHLALGPSEGGARGRLAGLPAIAALPVWRPSTSAFRRNPVLSAAAGGVEGLGTSETVAPVSSRPEPSSIVSVVSPVAGIPRVEGRSRWSVSAWLFVRRGSGAAALAPAGTLGGSQAGARASYRLTGRPGEGLALSLRLYAPLRDKDAAEAALGLDWKPLRALPLRLLAERRGRLGRDGRSAFGLTAYGGEDHVALGPLRLSVYGQAGVVGVRRRDLFADGAARLTLPVGRFRLGAGAWAASQPGVSRLDAGPHAELSLRAGGGSVTLAADWRFRVAGRGRPGSGPAITLSTGF
jgi:hypothetical protein